MLQNTPLHPSEQGKSRNTVAIGVGHPQDCVTVTSPRQRGMAQVAQSSRVAVTVGQPVCELADGVTEGGYPVVQTGPPRSDVRSPSWAATRVEL